MDSPNANQQSASTKDIRSDTKVIKLKSDYDSAYSFMAWVNLFITTRIINQKPSTHNLIRLMGELCYTTLVNDRSPVQLRRRLSRNSKNRSCPVQSRRPAKRPFQPPPTLALRPSPRRLTRMRVIPTTSRTTVCPASRLPASPDLSRSTWFWFPRTFTSLSLSEPWRYGRRPSSEFSTRRIRRLSRGQSARCW